MFNSSKMSERKHIFIVCGHNMLSTYQKRNVMSPIWIGGINKTLSYQRISIETFILGDLTGTGGFITNPMAMIIQR